MILKIRLLLLFLLVFSGVGWAQEVQLDPSDKARLVEAFELSRQIGDTLWDGWSQTPFTLLLVTQTSEFLFNHPFPTDDFKDLGYDTELQTNVFYRPNTGGYSTSFLATFPAINGQNTVVMGQPAATNKSSTFWVITALHEHFHQLQFSHPDYWEKVAALDLTGGDTTGMWMLNYPFPYANSNVSDAFAAYESSLAAAMESPELPAFQELAASRSHLESLLSEKDARYQAFQLWQEGVARYTELKVAQWAAETFRSTTAFTALSDHVSYAEATERLMTSIVHELNEHAITRNGRIAFYAAGAAEAYLLDFQNSAWKRSYFDDLPSLEAHTVKF